MTYSKPRQKVRGADGRYTKMLPCDLCGRRAVLYPETDPNYPEVLGKDICVVCSTKVRGK